MVILVDTNVLLRIAEPKHSLHRQAIEILRKLRQEKHVLCVVPQIHYEFWVVATRPLAVNGLGMTTDDASIELQKIGPPLFRFLCDDRSVYDRWHQLVLKHRVHGKSAHDARLIAAMQHHGVSHITTFNVADFRAFTGITVIDPQAPA